MRKEQDARWFNLRFRMGSMAAVLLPALAVAAGGVLLFHHQFPQSVVNSAAGVLFVDVTGVVLAVWKLVLSPSSTTRLEPVTTGEPVLEAKE